MFSWNVWLLLLFVSLLALSSVTRATLDDIEANGDQLFVARFDQPLCTDLIERVERVVGYRCDEFLHSNGLLLLLRTEEEHSALHAHLGDALVSVKALERERRCARLDVFSETDSASIGSQRKRAFLNGTVVDEVHHIGAPTRVALRLVLHRGALSRIDEILENVAEMVRPAIAYTIEGEPLVHIVDIQRSIDLEQLAGRLMDGVASLCHVEPLLEPEPINLWSASTIQLPDAMSASSLAAADSCSDAVCRPLWAAGLRGQGQLVAISDTGLASSACHFYDSDTPLPISVGGEIPPDNGHDSVRLYWRGTAGDFTDSNGHGTHVCGTVSGRATSGSETDAALDAHDFNGVAPDARLVIIDAHVSGGGISIPTPYDTNLLAFAWAAGARIHSGSWGLADWQYTEEDHRVDLFCWSHRSMVVVFAAGNSGASHGASSILSPALAKNALAIGAAMNGFTANDIASGMTPSESVDAYAYDWLAEFSSRGGTALDCTWMKPDIVAAGGYWVWSASSNSPSSCASVGSTVSGLAGTSMAAPAVAGAAAIIRQYFMGSFYRSTSFEPMASLVYALFIASATPLRGVFPEQPIGQFDSDSAYQPYGRAYLEGHGRASIASVLPLADTNTSSVAVLANENREFTTNGQMHRYCVQVAPGSVIHVAMGYTDYPSSVVDSPTGLMNDVDVRVYIDQSSTALHPNGLNGPDRGSTRELVRAMTTSGRVRIEVEGHSISCHTQDYSLIVVALTPNANIRVNGAIVPGNPASVPYSVSDGACSLCSGDQFTTQTCNVPTTTTTTTTTMTTTTIQATTTEATTTAETTTTEGTTTAQVTTVTPPPVTPAPTPAPPVCAHSVDALMRDMLVEHIQDDDDVCCRSPYGIAEAYLDGSGGAHDVWFERLARQLVTARINQRRGVVTTLTQRRAINEAASLLESRCTAGLFIPSDRHQARSLIDTLDSLNAGTCSSDSPVEQPDETCSLEQTRADAQYCYLSTYSFANDECQCSQAYHPGGTCQSLHCSGNGASLESSSTNNVERCVCFAGWTGTQCESCASSTGVEGTSYLCVGLVTEHVPESLSEHTHALRIVDSTTLNDRLSGTFYDEGYDLEDKPADQRPGTGWLDCQCRTVSPDFGSSPADTASNALDHAHHCATAYALAEPERRSSSMGIEPSPPSPAPTKNNASPSRFNTGWLNMIALPCIVIATTQWIGSR